MQHVRAAGRFLFSNCCIVGSGHTYIGLDLYRKRYGRKWNQFRQPEFYSNARVHTDANANSDPNSNSYRARDRQSEVHSSLRHLRPARKLKQRRLWLEHNDRHQQLNFYVVQGPTLDQYFTSDWI